MKVYGSSKWLAFTYIRGVIQFFRLDLFDRAVLRSVLFFLKKMPLSAAASGPVMLDLSRAAFAQQLRP